MEFIDDKCLIFTTEEENKLDYTVVGKGGEQTGGCGERKVHTVLAVDDIRFVLVIQYTERSSGFAVSYCMSCLCARSN